MIVQSRNTTGAPVLLDAETLPPSGSVVGDVELSAVVRLPSRVADRWIAARIAAWRAAHRKHADAAAPGIAAWREVRHGR